MSNRVFLNTQPIKSSLATKVQQEIMDKILEKYPDIDYLFIGSVGKRKDDDYNGDIDIAINCQNIETLNTIINDVFWYLESIQMESLYIISIKYPYLDMDEIKYVQCDFMIMWDKLYTSFRYWCPDYRENESKYKVGAKIMFTNMILNHTNERNKNLLEDEVGQFDFRPTALYRYVYKKDFSKYKEEFITLDPFEIASYCFKDSNPDHFISVETLWKAIHSDNFKYPDEVKELEKNLFKNSFKKGWTSIIPEDFELSYWTIEDIYKVINCEKIINEINKLSQNGHEY